MRIRATDWKGVLDLGCSVVFAGANRVFSRVRRSQQSKCPLARL